MIEITFEIILIAAILLVVLLAVIMFIRARSVRSIIDEAPPPPTVSPEQGISYESLHRGQEYSELMPQDIVLGSFSSQLQTADHNLRIEQVKDRVRYIVDGVSYTGLDQIPDTDIRRTLQKLFQKTFPVGPVNTVEALRQVYIGNQSTIETRSPDYTISVQNDGRQTRYVVNGLTYDSIREIPDPELQRKAKELASKMM